MAKINQPTTIKKNIENHPDRTENYAGGTAFAMDPKSRLYTRVATCLVGEPKYYKNINDDGRIDANQDKDLISDIKRVAKTDPEFVLKLAAYARNELYLRTVSIVVLVEASLIDECKPFVRQWTPAIVRRADELTEAVAYLQKRIGHLGNKSSKGSMPAGLKKGLADAFKNFDEYQLAKYNRKGFVKLKDVAKLVHPVPENEKQSDLFARLLKDELKTPDTWETNISTKGSSKETWEEIAPKMGYMALLRNLRNFMDHGVNMEPIINRLSDPAQVRNSKQWPFRFLSAYRTLQGHHHLDTSRVLDSLEEAMDLSVENLPRYKGTTFVTADNSGSMGQLISDRSTVTYQDIANTLMCVAHKLGDRGITGIFGQEFAVKQFSQRNGVLSNVRSIRNGEVGHSTNAHLAIEYLTNNKIVVDRILILSDMQCWNDDSWLSSGSVAEAVKKYKAKVNPNVFTYSIDLAGYGTLQIPEDEPKACLMAGWTEKILKFIPVFEEAGKTALDDIENYKAEAIK